MKRCRIFWTFRGLNMSYISFSLVFLLVLAPAMTVFVSNLDPICLKCICTASTGCNENYDCSPQGHCGPFFISKKYWEQAGRPKLNSNIYYSDGGFRDCVRNFQCAARTVSNFMALEGWDCNNDGVTDCEDYARIHFGGANNCDRINENSSFYKKYVTCRPPKTQDDFSLLKKK